jgi:hypothetical protein
VNIAIYAPPGRGKTYQVTTLPPDETLIMNIEGGLQSIGGFPVTSVDVIDLARKVSEGTGRPTHPWEICRALACIVSGYKSAVKPDNPYSRQSFDSYCQVLGGPENFANFKYMFWDSISVASRLCFEWVCTLPEMYETKNGKLNTMGAYGRVGQELTEWLTVIQHTPEKSTIIVAIADQKDDDVGRKVWKPQIVGGMGADALKGIFDQVLFLDFESFPAEQGGPQRVFVCAETNAKGLPVKSRGGFLGYWEPADLGHVIRKIQAGISGTAVGVVGAPGAEMPAQYAGSVE